MSGDPHGSFEGLTSRLKGLQTQATRLQALRDQKADDLKAKKAEVHSLAYRSESLGKVAELFHALIDELLTKQVRSVEAVVSEGLRAIFQEDALTLESSVDLKRGKAWVDLYFRQGNPSDPTSYKGKPLDSFGGGPSNVAALILRLLALLRMKKYPVLVLDETLAAVSDEYVDRTGQLLKKLAEDAGLDVLLVTHKAEFTNHAKRAYRCVEIEVDSGKSLALKPV